MIETPPSGGEPLGAPVPDWSPPPEPGPEPLVGAHVTLERLSAARRAEGLYAANRAMGPAAYERLWRYLPYGPYAALETYTAAVESWAQSADPRFYAILAASGSPVGVASYLRIAPENGSIEIGHICLSPALQRTTAATEALHLMMARAFELGYRRLEWKCDALNAPSRRAAARLGFTFEGVHRQATVAKGRNRDTAWFSVIDREWPALLKAHRTWLESPEDAKPSLSALTAPHLGQPTSPATAQ